ncbi:hypothetical protein L1987_31528 [Smallanthus sonchifolius]|uniref:Uncharacterized protein n=1 Tax=Smallanthus sonchifolius TaxID=185202 RepID=A0ACB9I5P0_9ASTR|nr:hypothetical protein L1987_31528 [Smallanthus sonchifolius]
MATLSECRHVHGRHSECRLKCRRALKLCISSRSFDWTVRWDLESPEMMIAGDHPSIIVLKLAAKSMDVANIVMLKLSCQNQDHASIVAVHLSATGNVKMNPKHHVADPQSFMSRD